MAENEYLNAICDYLTLKKHFFWRSNNIPVYEPARKCYRAMPKYSRKGVPDIILIRDGFFIGLEVKQPKKYLSKEQKQFKKDCEDNGAEYHMVRTIDDLQEIGL